MPHSQLPAPHSQLPSPRSQCRLQAPQCPIPSSPVPIPSAGSRLPAPHSQLPSPRSQCRLQAPPAPFPTGSGRSQAVPGRPRCPRCLRRRPAQGSASQGGASLRVFPRLCLLLLPHPGFSCAEDALPAAPGAQPGRRPGAAGPRGARGGPVWPGCHAELLLLSRRQLHAVGAEPDLAADGHQAAGARLRRGPRPAGGPGPGVRQPHRAVPRGAVPRQRVAAAAARRDPGRGQLHLLRARARPPQRRRGSAGGSSVLAAQRAPGAGPGAAAGGRGGADVPRGARLPRGQRAVARRPRGHAERQRHHVAGGQRPGALRGAQRAACARGAGGHLLLPGAQHCAAAARPRLRHHHRSLCPVPSRGAVADGGPGAVCVGPAGHPGRRVPPETARQLPGAAGERRDTGAG